MAVIYVCDICNKVKDKYFLEEYGYEGENDLLCQECFDKENRFVYVYLLVWSEETLGKHNDWQPSQLEFYFEKQSGGTGKDKSVSSYTLIKKLRFKTLIKEAEKWGFTDEYDGELKEELGWLLIRGNHIIDDEDIIKKIEPKALEAIKEEKDDN